MASLTSMPELVMERILKHCDFREVQTLRKVCHNLRDFIDCNKPDAKIDVIDLRVFDGYIGIAYTVNGRRYNVTYRNQGSSCEIECQGRKKILNDSNYVDAVLKDFPIILGFQTSSLDSLRVRAIEGRVRQSREDSVYDATLRMLSSVLKSRKTLLKTRHMVLNVLQQHHMLSILPYLDSNGLDVLEILDPMSYDRLLTLDLDEVVKLEQWKATKELHIKMIRFPHRLENFEHFTEIHLLADELHFEDMEYIKNNLLGSTTIDYLCFHWRKFENQSQFMRSLGPPAEVPLFFLQEWYFRMKNSSDVLKIIWNGTITFARVQESAVSEGIPIRD